MRTDRTELNNLAQNPELADVRVRLQNAFDEWMRQQGDKGLQTELEAYNQMTKPKPR